MSKRRSRCEALGAGACRPAKSQAEEYIRKNWVYTPATRNSLLVTRRSLAYGISNLYLRPAKRWGFLDRPGLS